MKSNYDLEISGMSSKEWIEVRLGDLLNFRRGHDLPKDKIISGKIPVVGSNGIIGFHNEYTTKAPCLTIGRSGNIGNPFYKNEDCWAHNTTLYVDNFKSNDPKYLFYLLQTMNLAFYGGGSAVPTLNRNHIHPLLVKYTQNVYEQKTIADTLLCLDDKIELNNRINKNLEEMAQTIFKSWFVDFEPFQDGEFEDSELGKIPKRWEVGTISKLISETIGGDWGKEISESNYSEEVTCIRGADIPEISIGRKGRCPTRYILKKNLEKKKLTAGQIVIEISGGSPTQSTGRSVLVTENLLKSSNRPLICTNFCRSISLKDPFLTSYVYSLLQFMYKKDFLFQFENGTTGIKNLDTNNLFNKYLIVIPPKIELLKFERIFELIMSNIYENGRQSDYLNETLSIILPKLMSGEIRVPVQED